MGRDLDHGGASAYCRSAPLAERARIGHSARTFPTWTWNELGEFLDAVSGHGAEWSDDGLVFCQIAGAAINPGLLTNWWRQLVRRHAPSLGLPAIRPHDL